MNIVGKNTERKKSHQKSTSTKRIISFKPRISLRFIHYTCSGYRIYVAFACLIYILFTNETAKTV